MCQALPVQMSSDDSFVRLQLFLAQADQQLNSGPDVELKPELNTKSSYPLIFRLYVQYTVFIPLLQQVGENRAA